MLDEYDAAVLDDKDYAPLAYDDMRAAEAAMEDRDRREGRRGGRLGAAAESDEEEGASVRPSVRPSVRLASRPPHHLSPPASPHPFDLHLSPPSFAAESDGVGFREQRRRRREMEDAAAGGAGAEGGAGDEEPFKLETFQVPLREWVGQEQTRAEIKRRFKLFLQTFVNASGTKVRRDDGREGGGEEGRRGVPRAAPPRNTTQPPTPTPSLLLPPFYLRARRCTRR